MNSATTKIIAIVAVIAVVGAGAFVLIGNSGDDDKETTNIKTALAVYGNANNDTAINNDDVKIIEKIIKGDLKAEDYPFADANGDGSITDADVTLTKAIIDKTATTVYIRCLNASSELTKMPVEYPLKNIVGIGANMMPVLINSGSVPALAGRFTLNYENEEAALKDVYFIGDASRAAITTEVWNNFKALDTNLIKTTGSGIGAFFVDHSLGSAITASHRADLAEAGIPEIRLAVADPFEDISAAMLLGFLIGGESETTARNYAEKSWTVLDTITEKLSGLTDANKKTYIGITMSYYICQNSSTFGQIGSYVSGIPYYTVNEEFKTKYAGTTSTAMSSVEALSNYAIKSKLGDNRGIEYIFSNRSIDFCLDTNDATIISEWEKKAGKTGFTTKDFFKDLDCYENLYYINNLLPGACKLAYAAAAMYPDLYSMDDANNATLSFTEFCPTLKGATLENSLFCFGYDDYVKAKAKASA